MFKIKNLFATIKNSFGYFSCMYIFCFLASIFSSIAICTENEIFEYFLLDATWMIVFSVLIKIGSEKIPSKIEKTLSILIPIIFSVPVFFFCEKAITGCDHFFVTYWSSFCVMLCGAFYLLTRNQKEKKGANIVVSFFVALLLSASVGGSLSLIVATINFLICEIYRFDNLIESIWIFSGYIIFIGTFISYLTKDYEQISIPKIIKIVFNYSILPLFAVYLLVLYIYFVKCIATKSMPSGMINPFVSIATCAYMLLYLTLESFENPATKFFYKFGGLFLIPLFILQIMAFYIRVDSYGFTMPRYFSLLYIIFSSSFIVLAILKGLFNFKIQLTELLFLILGGILFLSIFPKINAVDVTNNSLRKRIENIYESHGLLKNGMLVTENANNILTVKEKAEIVDFYNQLNECEKNIPWIKNSFTDTYGFEIYHYSDKKISFEVKNNKSIFNIDGYKTLKVISEAKSSLDPLDVVIKTINGESYEITSEIEKYLIEDSAKTEIFESPVELILKGGDLKIVLLRGSVCRYSPSYVYSSFDGYVLEK